MFRVYGTRTEVKVATWSPDGQLLAFVDPNEGVGVRDLNSRSFRMLLLERRVVSLVLVGFCWVLLVGWLATVGFSRIFVLGFCSNSRFFFFKENGW